MDDFVDEVRWLFEAPLELRQLMLMSGVLGEEYKEKLQSSDISMLPSYQHTLPTGKEKGDFLALDVGGSTLRIALVRLAGEEPGVDKLQTKRIRTFAIDRVIRDLQGREFFDWMADRIAETLTYNNRTHSTQNAKLPMGLAWSFPIEQTSQRSGRILAMGKGFRALQGVEGQDLTTLIMTSCQRKNLNVTLKAIVNDSSATLLAQAYLDPRTRISLILGTGTNSAIYLPTSLLGRSKLLSRPAQWTETPPPHLVINTEMSMFGGRTLPQTRWDKILNSTHPLPDFQPLEYKSTGRYLGEIVRLILLEASESTAFFSQTFPPSLLDPYTLETTTLAAFEADSSHDLHIASAVFQASHPLLKGLCPSVADLRLVRTVSRFVTTRAAAFIACALHALWKLRTEAEGLGFERECEARVTVACNGGVVEKFPGFRRRVQGVLDGLCGVSCGGDGDAGRRNWDGEGGPGGEGVGMIELKIATGESCVSGAGVAVACADAEG